MSADLRSDFFACTTWGFREDKWFLLDVWRGKLDYPDLKAKVLKLAKDFNPDRVLIEDAISGKSLLRELRRDNRRLFQSVRLERDKEMRFQAACAPVEEGLVLLPDEADWLPAFKRELQLFPRGRNNDQVDSFSQFLNWSKGNGLYRALGRDHPLVQARRELSRMRARHR